MRRQLKLAFAELPNRFSELVLIHLQDEKILPAAVDLGKGHILTGYSLSVGQNVQQIELILQRFGCLVPCFPSWPVAVSLAATFA